MPEAIEILAARLGTFDELAHQLGTTRQTVLRWKDRKKPMWPRKYIEGLRELGVPARLLTRTGNLEELDARARRLEAEVTSLREEIERLR